MTSKENISFNDENARQPDVYESLYMRPVIAFQEPSDDDSPDDPWIKITHRNLARVISVAALAGARFAKERRYVDPVEWMYTPQRIFHDASAVAACLFRDDYDRAIILHGLSLSGLTTAGQIDTLLNRHGFSDVDEQSYSWTAYRSGVSANGEKRHLFTAAISDSGNQGRFLIFTAMIASDAYEVWVQLRDRYGERTADLAIIKRGFDPSEPIAIALVSEPMADTLQLIAQAPTSTLAEGLEVQIESRFIN